ncbi:MAG: hypothetical protein WC022_02870 [Parcubacteria group bacterium]
MDNEQAEKNVVHEAEILAKEKPTEPTVTKIRKKRNDFYIELALFFILGILIGVAVKNEAVKKITMGFDDYKMKIYKQDYDLNALQTKMIQDAADAQAATAAKSADTNGAAKPSDQAAAGAEGNVPTGR